MENVLLNSPYCNCMKEFLRIICNENLDELKNLQKSTEKKYQELDKSFYFKEINENAFKFPKFKEEGTFGELDFSDISNNRDNNVTKSHCEIL